MAILNNSNAISSGGYDINNSLRFRASASAYLSRTPASTGNRQTFTYSFWMKRGTLGTLQRFIGVSDNATGDFIIQWTTSNTLEVYDNGPAGTSLITTQVFRDPSAWYHIVITYDTTNATAANRVRVYVNGSQVTAFGTAVYPAQNTNSFNNQASIPARIGIWPSGSQYFDGYISEFYFIDGSAKAASDFGETDATTGSWKPKAYSGTYGTNGFYLKFSDIATTSGSNAGLGKDFSGNTNYWTTNNISVTSGTTYDAMKDSPTNTSATVANYCVWNPLFNPTNKTFSDGNLKFVNITSSSPALSTIGVRSGKWYGEFTFPSDVSNMNIGLAKDTLSKNTYVGADTGGIGVFSGNGSIYYNGTAYTYGSSFTAGDIIMIAFDADNGKIWWGKNGTWFNSGNPASGTNPGVASSGATVNVTLDFTQEWFFGSGTDVSNGSIANFGQRPFAYTPPTGFVALNTFNLPTPTILQGNKYMDATTYTSSGTTQVITNQGQFKPDFVWTKVRGTTSNHTQVDSVRGANKYLVSNSTAAEDTAANYVTSFNSNGFSLGSDNYASGNTLVAWQWQAGQGSTSSNTSGSITTTTSVNATAGFSVFTFTGTGASASVGHGLGVAPKFMVFKRRNSTSDWNVLTNAAGSNQYGFLNLTAAFASAGETWTSTVINIGGNFANGATYVCYAWAEIAGFSKFGSYVGNGTQNAGPFVYTGFRPEFVLIKNTTNYDWHTFDSTRSPYNYSGCNVLKPNSSAAELTARNDVQIDILSNGFRLIGEDVAINGNGNTHIYMAFAENPFKNANAR